MGLGHVWRKKTAQRKREGGEEIVTADSERTHRILMFPPLLL